MSSSTLNSAEWSELFLHLCFRVYIHEGNRERSSSMLLLSFHGNDVHTCTTSNVASNTQLWFWLLKVVHCPVEQQKGIQIIGISYTGIIVGIIDTHPHTERLHVH